MSIKKIIAIAVIFFVGWGGWLILGTVTSIRSHDFSAKLGPRVKSLWGTNLVQNAPQFSVKIPGTKQVRWLMPKANTITAQIEPDYKKKGLIWYSTYHCTFEGKYLLRNDEAVTQKIRLHFDFPDKGGTYDEFSMHINDRLISATVNTKTGIDDIIELEPGHEMSFKIKYKTRGLDTWKYRPDKNIGRVHDFSLTINTGFRNIDYTADSLSPMSVNPFDEGLTLEWKATDLITNSNIGIIVPEKLNPGPLTTRITYFAPVCLLFFFILIAAIGIMYKIDIHPMHYLFVTCGFFAFHLLLSYMAGHFWIHFSFLVSAFISVFLVTTYLSAALGKQFPWKPAVAGQLFFLVLFSYTFFIKGITGLIVAAGSVITLAVLMKVTARIKWDDIFKKNQQNLKSAMAGKKGVNKKGVEV